jgi:Fe-S oxidoreductase
MSGAGGGVYFTRGELAGSRDRFVASGLAGTVVTGCPFCKEELEAAVSPGTQVRHYLELLGA